ncbi:MAG: hypothetical protein Kow0076_4870 [Francisella sp.]
MVVISDDISPIATEIISSFLIANLFIKIPEINIASHIDTLINVKAKPILLLLK